MNLLGDLGQRNGNVHGQNLSTKAIVILGTIENVARFKQVSRGSKGIVTEESYRYRYKKERRIRLYK
jgi:Mrp family chromosome partitioning ATPase